MAHPTREGFELAMNDSTATQLIRLGKESLSGNALPFSIGTQVAGPELSDAAVGVGESREHDVFLSAMSRSSHHRSRRA
jgi:hypothetical protein